jgi:hypothetical protein
MGGNDVGVGGGAWVGEARVLGTRLQLLAPFAIIVTMRVASNTAATTRK